MKFGVGFPGGSDSKESACSVGDLGSIPGLGRPPGGGHGKPLQYYYSVLTPSSQITESPDYSKGRKSFSWKHSTPLQPNNLCF